MKQKTFKTADGKVLPAPRLQLRWTPNDNADRPDMQWRCHYELILPLDKHDIRGEQEGPRGGKRPNLTELVVPIKPPSLRGSDCTPCTAPYGTRYYDPPYRDGVHAQWDAKALGNPPIFVIAPDGVAFERQADPVNS